MSWTFSISREVCFQQGFHPVLQGVLRLLSDQDVVQSGFAVADEACEVDLGVSQALVVCRPVQLMFRLLVSVVMS